jgi:flagellar motor switch protein FliG
LPDNIRAEVILRMANLEYVEPEKVDELDQVLKKELAMSGKSQVQQLGGILAVADLVNNLDKKTMNSVMTRLEDKDPILTEEIRQHMFTFTDITKIDDRGVQLILREVPTPKLLLSLKSAPDEVRDKIYSAMSQRAAEMMREDLAALGPQKVSEVEGAQREITTIVKRLQEEGKIVIGFSEDQEVIP